MAYGMKYTKGNFPFKTSPLTDKGHGGKKGHNHNDASDEQSKEAAIKRGDISRPEPTYEGTDEFRKDKDISTKEKKSRGIIEEVNLSKMSGLGPRLDFGGVKNPELNKTKKSNQKKVMIDGNKNKAVSKGGVVKGNWQASQFRK